MKHDWERLPQTIRDWGNHGRRRCRKCGVEQTKHDEQLWMRVVGYHWWPRVGRCKGKPMRWKRVCEGQQKLLDADGQQAGLVLRMENCGYWYAYLWDNEDPDGTRFLTMREAKRYVEKEAMDVSRRPS